MPAYELNPLVALDRIAAAGFINLLESKSEQTGMDPANTGEREITVNAFSIVFFHDVGIFVLSSA